MAFDGITTACLREELSRKLTGGRINKIQQTEKDELVLTISLLAERGGGQARLYLSADPSLPLCYLTSRTRPAPLSAPAFCMLLRKHLQSGRIISVTQPGLERILRFTVEHLNEMGDVCRHTLLIELMGKHSNIIFLDEDERIVDSIRRVSSMISSVREVLPGRDYFVPTPAGKCDPLAEMQKEFLSKLDETPTSVPAFFTRSYTGISSVISEEICLRAHLSQEESTRELTGEDRASLWSTFSEVMEDVRAARFSPAIYYRGTSAEFAAIVLDSFHEAEKREFSSISELLETYYAEKNEETRIRQKSSDLRHIVSTILERDLHKYDLQMKQIRDTEKKEKYRLYGELITAYVYSIPEGAKEAQLDNWYTGEVTRVPVDPALTASENAKKYFDRYTKLKRTYEALSQLTVEVKQEIDHLKSIQMSLEIATDEGDLSAIRKELEESGYVRAHRDAGGHGSGVHNGAKKKGAAPKGRTPQSRPLHYLTSDGYDVYVGKNNAQNDELTFHMAQGSDIWFHANDMPGSHVILLARGQKLDDIPDRAFEEAASLAAYYSSGRDQSKVEIDYLERRNVKKPGGAKPGFVVYYTNYSIMAGTDISGLQQIE